MNKRLETKIDLRLQLSELCSASVKLFLAYVTWKVFKIILAACSSFMLKKKLRSWVLPWRLV